MQASSPRLMTRFVRAMRWQGFAWLVLVATLLATAGLSQYSRAELQRVNADRFDYLVQRQSARLADRILDYERVLKGAAGLFAASGDVTREEWRKYVERLDLEQTLPGIQGTGFTVMIPASGKAAHVAAIRAEGFPRYEIRPAGARSMYSSIVFLEPFVGRNLRAFGYDMYSEPVRREAMNRARDTGAPAMSGRVTLVQETDVDVQWGFLIYVPVYFNGMPTETVEQRRAALHGFTYSPFRSGDLMQSLFRDPRREVEVEIHDGPPGSQNLLFASLATPRAARDTSDQLLTIGGRKWHVRFHSSEDYERRTQSYQPELIVAIGLLLGLLLWGAIINDARHSQRLEQQVRERTRELERARDEAESASRAKSAFLATVSHELRTPLNAIIGFSSILLEEPAFTQPGEQRKQLQIINDSGRHLLELIKDILDVTSIEAGQLNMHVTVVDLRRILEEQVASLQTLAAERSLALRLEPAAECVDVLADGTRLRQVLRNLIANAIKFTDHGSVTLRQVVDGDTVRIEVIDTGIGITSADQALLFNPFQRIRDHGGPLRPGTGLGLAISRRLVEGMDGEIGCASAQGQGSRFWFTLPIARRGKAALRVA